MTKHVSQSLAGFLLQKELDYLDGAIKQPKKPFAAIVGGSKVCSHPLVLSTAPDVSCFPPARELRRSRTTVRGGVVISHGAGDECACLWLQVSSKIGVIESLIEKVDKIILGGGMIFTFFKARGLSVGNSLVEEDKLELAKELETKAKAKGEACHESMDHTGCEISPLFSELASRYIVEYLKLLQHRC